MNIQAEPTAAEISESAERDQEHNEADPFPPEGTDEKILTDKIGQPAELKEADRLKATEAVIRSGLSNGSET